MGFFLKPYHIDICEELPTLRSANESLIIKEIEVNVKKGYELYLVGIKNGSDPDKILSTVKNAWENYKTCQPNNNNLFNNMKNWIDKINYGVILIKYKKIKEEN